MKGRPMGGLLVWERVVLPRRGKIFRLRAVKELFRPRAGLRPRSPWGAIRKFDPALFGADTNFEGLPFYYCSSALL